MFTVDNKSRMNKGATILIVEDEHLVRELLCEVIQLFQPTWRIYEAKNGREGLEIAQAKRPDLIVLDFPVTGLPLTGLPLSGFPTTAYPTSVLPRWDAQKWYTHWLRIYQKHQLSVCAECIRLFQAH